MPSRLPKPLLTLLLLLLPVAAAQPLLEVAPPGAALALYSEENEAVLDTVERDLAALDWSGAAETLSHLLAFGAATNPDASEVDELMELAELLRQLARGETPGTGGTLPFECPAGDAALAELEGYEGSGGESLVTVGFAPYNPLPAVTILVRADDPAVQSAFTELGATVIDCAREAGLTVTELPQGETTLYSLGDPSMMFAMTVAWLDDLVVLGTNPDLVRASVRLATGSEEPSLADGRLWRETARFERGRASLGLAVDFTELADYLDGAFGWLAHDPDTGWAFSRAVAALRTVGGVAWQGTATDDGLILERITAVDPDGGDAALAELLLCRDCAVSGHALAPAGSVAAYSTALRPEPLLDYLQGWLDDAAAVLGEEVDLRELFREELGIDLDVALFDWLGGELHLVRLEPRSTDLRNLIYQPGWALVVPVTSEEAARRGLEELGRAVLEDSGLADAYGADLPFAVTETTYRGAAFTRVRALLNLDVGLAFVDDQLVLGMPASAARRVIDTHLGSPSLIDSAAWAEVGGAAPAGATSLGYRDLRAELRGLASLLDLLPQPLAGTAHLALLEQAMGEPVDNGWWSGLDPQDLTPEPLAPGVVESNLSQATGDPDGDRISDFYALGELAPGTRVEVVLESDEFDTYLFLIDGATGQYLDSNDDAPGIDRSALEFTARAGVEYWVQVTSWWGDDEGAYRLTLATTPGAAPAELPAPPTYADLLDLFEIVPRAVSVLANHVSTATSHTEVDGDTIYGRTTIRVRW